MRIAVILYIIEIKKEGSVEKFNSKIILKFWKVNLIIISWPCLRNLIRLTFFIILVGLFNGTLSQEWCQWSDCSTSCGTGFKRRLRICNKSKSSLKFPNYYQNILETADCNRNHCPGIFYFICYLYHFIAFRTSIKLSLIF